MLLLPSLACQRQEQTLGFGRAQSLGVLDGKEAFLVLSPGTGLCSTSTARFRCSSHAEGTALGMGSTPGCWAVNPAGDPWKEGGNSWSRTQSYVNPCMLLWLSFTSRGSAGGAGAALRGFSQRMPDSREAGKGRGRPCKTRLSLLWLNRLFLLTAPPERRQGGIL